MFRSSLLHLAAATALAAAAFTTPAAAGGCCPCACTPYGEAAAWGADTYYAPPTPMPYYIVNQGPDYSGNFITSQPTIDAAGPPVDFPYVGRHAYRPYGIAPFYAPHHGYYRPRLMGPGVYRDGFHYRHAFGPRPLTVTAGAHGSVRSRRYFGVR